MKRFVMIWIAMFVLLTPVASFAHEGSQHSAKSSGMVVESDGGIIGVIEEIGSENLSLTLESGLKVIVQDRTHVKKLSGEKTSVKMLSKGQHIKVFGEVDLSGIFASEIIVLPLEQ